MTITNLFLFGLLLSGALAVDVCDDTDECPDSCEPPDCSCSGATPKNIPLKDRPQIVYLTFDDAFTKEARKNFYDKIFTGKDAVRNPNGDPIRATHFITHKYNDYIEAHKYYSRHGHEMAALSITHRDNLTYWETLSKKGWSEEMGGMKDMMNIYGKMELKDIKGFRAPFLQVGGDNMIEAAVQDNFEYDCSMPSRRYGYTNINNGLWPYTLEYKSTQDCSIQPCPTCSYPDFWVQPMLDLEDDRESDSHPGFGEPCSMFDACIIPSELGTGPDLVENMLLKSFNRSYNGNTRAPYGIHMHAAWFYGESWHLEGYIQFLKTITNKNKYQDVWIVPVSAGIEYMKNPVPKQQLKYFKPFLYDEKNFPKFQCYTEKVCRYENVDYEDFKEDELYFHFCGERCPTNYPYLGNVLGN